MCAKQVVNRASDQEPAPGVPASRRVLLPAVERVLEKVSRRRGIRDKALADFFHKMQTMLAAGLRVDQAMRSAVPGGNGALQRALKPALRRVKAGKELGDALRRSGAFSPLITELVAAGEAAGALSEVCGYLTDHVQRRMRFRRRLMARLAWPVLQLVLAIFVITVLILVLGLVAQITGETVDILGLGLIGVRGAAIFLGGIAAAVAGGWLGYRLLVRTLGRRGAVHRLLLGLPIVGDVMRNFALARFTWALHLTSEAATPLAHGLALSLRATDNAAFTSVVEPVSDGIDQGNEVAPTLSATGLFSTDFLENLHVAEMSGTIPETMQRMSGEYWRRSETALNTLAWAIAICVWIGVSGIIILAIFRIFSFYIAGLNSLM